MDNESALELAATKIASAPAPDDEGRDFGAPKSGSRAVEDEMVEYRKWMESRDRIIREADQEGVSEARIARLMGHSRNTVRKALERN